MNEGLVILLGGITLVALFFGIIGEVSRRREQKEKEGPSTVVECGNDVHPEDLRHHS